MGVPYTFASQSGPIPLSQLDADFAACAPITPTITATVASGILTVTLVSPAGIVGQSQGTPWNKTISSNYTITTVDIAASLGATTAQQTRLAVVYLYNNDTLGLINMSGGSLLDESNTFTPVVMSAGATSATTMYSPSGTTASSYKVLGFLDATWTSGTGWATPANILSASAAAYTGVGGLIKGQSMVQGTLIATTSGTSIDFTGIPSWAKRITVMFNGVSSTGTNQFLIQIGSGSVTTSGYAAESSSIASTVGTVNSTSGFIVYTNLAANAVNGIMTICNAGGFLYVSGHQGMASSTNTVVGGGAITLAGVLDRIRLTTVGGTDTFDAGSVNILYE